jgi:hypothetical protein
MIPGYHEGRRCSSSVLILTSHHYPSSAVSHKFLGKEVQSTLRHPRRGASRAPHIVGALPIRLCSPDQPQGPKWAR